MSARSWSIRSRLVAVLLVPLVTLTALWAFSTYVTLGGGLNLYNVSELGAVSEKGETAMRAVQAERRDSAIYLGDQQANHSQLDKDRTATDDAVTVFRTAAGDGSVQNAASSQLRQLLADEMQAFDQLKTYRAKVDARQVARGTAIDDFTTIIDGMFRAYNAVASLDDPDIANRAAALIAVSRGREMLSREDAVLAGAIAAGRFTGTDFTQYAQLVGASRYQLVDSVAKLPDASQSAYQQEVAGTASYATLHKLEDAVVAKGRPGQRPPVSGADWTTASSGVLAEIGKFELTGADQTLAAAKPVAYGVIARILIAGLLGLAALVLSIVLSLRTARGLVHQLRELRDSAREIAGDQLPAVVERLRRGEEVDVATAVPPLDFGEDEIGEVGQAFNAVQQTAIRSAVEQAEMTNGFSNVFLNIARRSQTLLQRQLGHLDVMERKAEDPDDLEDLFRIDHLATRMRRNAENLVILGGSQPVRQWAKPVPMLDVLRSAGSEVEEYQRVQVLPVGEVVLAGSAVSDVVHMLAELMDNATQYSPGHAKVHVSGQLVPRGFAIEIEDRGRGLSVDELTAANKWLREPPEFNVLALAENARLGMFVVSRIAGRHGIRVSLRGSPYGGTTAIVLLPTSLVAEAAKAEDLARRDAAEVKSGVRPPRPVDTGETEIPRFGVTPTSPAPAQQTFGQPTFGEPDQGGPGQEWPGLAGAGQAGHHQARQPDPEPGPGGRSGRLTAAGAFGGRPSDAARTEEPPLWSDSGRAGDASATSEISRVRDASTGELPRIRDGATTGELGRVRDGATGELPRVRDSATGEIKRIGADYGGRFGDDGRFGDGAAGSGHDDGWPRLGELPPPRQPGAGGAHRAPGLFDDPPSPAAEPEHGQPGQFGQPGGAGYGGAGPTGPEPSASTVRSGETHLGLPKRVRQASLSPELRDDPRRPSPSPRPATRERTPDEIRAMMSSYQRGTIRGRTLAQQDPELPVQPERSGDGGPEDEPGATAEYAPVVPEQAEDRSDGADDGDLWGGARPEPRDRSLPSASAPTETFPRISSISSPSGEEG